MDFQYIQDIPILNYQNKHCYKLKNIMAISKIHVQESKPMAKILYNIKNDNSDIYDSFQLAVENQTKNINFLEDPKNIKYEDNKISIQIGHFGDFIKGIYLENLDQIKLIKSIRLYNNVTGFNFDNLSNLKIIKSKFHTESNNSEINILLFPEYAMHNYNIYNSNNLEIISDHIDQIKPIKLLFGVIPDDYIKADIVATEHHIFDSQNNNILVHWSGMIAPLYIRDKGEVTDKYKKLMEEAHQEYQTRILKYND